MCLKKIIIHRSANAFLYLPVYIAEELGFFKNLLPNVDIEIPFVKEEHEGDINALKRMSNSNKFLKNSISICISDPTAYLSKEWEDKEESNHFRLIGALIKKLPFWGFNHLKQSFNNDSAFNSYYEEIVFYDKNLVTGNFIGKKIFNESNNIKFQERIKKYGEEFDAVKKRNNVGHNPKAFGVTADLVGLTKNVLTDNVLDKLFINYNFSEKKDEFLTTGITTTKNVIETYTEELAKVIEGIQKAMLILSSSDLASEYVVKILNKKYDYEMNDSQIKFALNKIRKEKIYPNDMNITMEGWGKAITARADVEGWKKVIIPNTFIKHVNNKIVLKSEKELARKLGIDLFTFQDEFVFYEDELKRKKTKESLYDFKKNVKYVLKYFLKFSNKISVIIVLGLIIYIASETFFGRGLKAMLNTFLPFFIAYIFFWINNKNNAKDK